MTCFSTKRRLRRRSISPKRMGTSPQEIKHTQAFGSRRFGSALAVEFDHFENEEEKFRKVC